LQQAGAETLQQSRSYRYGKVGAKAKQEIPQRQHVLDRQRAREKIAEPRARYVPDTQSHIVQVTQQLGVMHCQVRVQEVHQAKHGARDRVQHGKAVQAPKRFMLLPPRRAHSKDDDGGDGSHVETLRLPLVPLLVCLLPPLARLPGKGLKLGTGKGASSQRDAQVHALVVAVTSAAAGRLLRARNQLLQLQGLQESGDDSKQLGFCSLIKAAGVQREPERRARPCRRLRGLAHGCGGGAEV
jgi:hypothetical protein